MSLCRLGFWVVLPCALVIGAGCGPGRRTGGGMSIVVLDSGVDPFDGATEMVDGSRPPREDSGPGRADSGPLPDEDAGPDPFDAGPTEVDAGPRDAGPAPTSAPTSAGEVVVTELMRNPNAVLDAEGEWLELYNPSTTRTYDLRGCEIYDFGSDHHVIASSLVLRPRSYVTLAVTSAPGFTPSYVYSSFNLSNTEDEVVLSCGSVQIDAVFFDATFVSPVGATMSLAPSALDASSNDFATSWCAGSTDYHAGDRGTPGAPNDPCF